MVSKASENFDSVTTSTVGNVSDARVARLFGRVPGICRYFVLLYRCMPLQYAIAWCVPGGVCYLAPLAPAPMH